MADKAPTRSEILDLKRAQSETSQDLSERLVRIETLVNKQEDRNDKQESRNQGAFYAVMFGFVLIVITVAVEVILSTKHDDTMYTGMYGQIISNQSEISNDQSKISNIQNQIDLLKAKNSYLK